MKEGAGEDKLLNLDCVLHFAFYIICNVCLIGP